MKKELTKEKEEKGERAIVVPGETIATGVDFLPGDGTKRDGKEIIALRFGLLEKEGKLVKIIPLNGAYIPRAGNTVIGQVTDISFNGWIIDVLAPYQAFLSTLECFGFVNKKDLAEYFNIGDIIVSKIRLVKPRSVELTMKERDLGALDDGLLIKINPTRVPRVIGRAGSMVNTIKEETGCNIVVGQNGLIWIKGKNIEDEIAARKAIDLIVEKPFVDGLTDQIKNFLKELKKK